MASSFGWEMHLSVAPCPDRATEPGPKRARRAFKCESGPGNDLQLFKGEAERPTVNRLDKSGVPRVCVISTVVRGLAKKIMPGAFIHSSRPT